MQVILDYYWIPPGTWQTIHWKPSFFKDNLPAFVKENLLHYGSLYQDIRLIQVSKHIEGGNYITSDCATVYLPFCEKCLVEVVSSYDILSRTFTIAFLEKHELNEHLLWKATNTISPKSMQDWLEKKLNQEEEYCKLTRQKLAWGSAIGSNHVDKDAVLDIFGRIVNVENVRMIKLTALRNYHPEFQHESSPKTWPCNLGVSVGGYVGLLKCSTKTKIKAPINATVSKPNSTKAAPSKRKPYQSKAPIPSKTEAKGFLIKLASLLHGNEDAIELSDSDILIIKSVNELEDILPLSGGGSTAFFEVNYSSFLDVMFMHANSFQQRVLTLVRNSFHNTKRS